MALYFNFRWRAERREAELKMEVLTKKEMLTAARKAWTLDEEGDDEEEAVVAPDPDVPEVKEEIPEDAPPKIKAQAEAEEEAKNVVVVKMEEDEDDEDPLDAFMRGVQDEVRKMNNTGHSASTKGSVQKVVVVRSGTVKKAEKKDKGELIEQNMDGLEVNTI